MKNATYKTVNKLSSVDVKSISEPIVSFDLFDTLLRRKYLAVNEVHDTVSAYLLARLGKARDLTPGQLTLTRYNTGNFLKTSPHVDMEEPSLHIIWQKIIPTIGTYTKEELDRIIDDVIAFEFDLEIENLVTVEGTHDLLRDLKSHSKRLIAVSDMYFSKRQIETILQKLGILSFFEKVYVSVEAGATKQTGRLFGHVLNDLRVKPKTIHHIGDNAHSDIVMGSKAGLAVTRIDQPDKLHLERPAYGRRSDIHVEIADLTKSFLFKILFGAINNKTDHIYFMSRDGLLLRRVFEKWQSPLIQRYFDFFEQSDLFLSRATSCWLALNFRGEWLIQAVGFAFWLCHGKATLRQISDLFGIEEVPLDQDDTLFSSSTDTALVVRAYETAQLADKVRNSLMAKRQLAEEYLAQAKLFSARHVTLCDIGYSGTVARDLNSFFLQESVRFEAPRPPKVELELLSTNANYNSNAALAQPYIRFGGNSILPSSKLPEALVDSFAWLEVFFKHPSYGPLKGYLEKGGRTIPDYDTDTTAVDNYPYEKIISASAFKSEDIVLLWMSSINFWDQLIDPLIGRFAAPDMNTVGQMHVDIYENDAITNRKRSIILLRPDLSATEIYSLAKRDDYWIPGSVLASANVDMMPTKQSSSGGSGTLQSNTTIGQTARNERRAILPKKFQVRNLRRALVTNIRLARSKLDRRKFDARFYRAYYPDLAAFDEAALRNHYIQHGREEGRFAEPNSLIAHLEQECGPLPKDFDAFVYRKLHSDLPFDEEWQLKAHYLQFGRSERRRYQSDIDIDEHELQDLVGSGVIELTAAERTAHKDGASIRSLLLKRSNIEVGPWLDLFDYGEFQALNYQWAGRVQSRSHALAVFLDRGPANLAALSLNGRFDHSYYIRIHPELADLSAEGAYRFWLRHGAGAGEAASEDDRLFQLLGERAFPVAFRADLFADRYQTSRDTEAVLDRVDLLALFLQGGFTSDTDLVQGPKASRIWEVVARNARGHGKLDEAIRAYENALDCNGAPGRILHKLGDIYASQQRLHDALQCYERCVDAPTPDRWSFINGARLAADLGYFDKALDFVSKGADIWAEKEPWRRARDHAYNALFNTSVVQSQRGEKAGAIVPALEQITKLISAEFSENRTLADPDGFALLLCDRQTHTQSLGALERIRSYVGHELGRDVKVFAYDQINSVLSSFAGAACVVFHEATSNPQTIRLALTARALCLPTAYWAGALDGSDVSAFRNENSSTRLASLLASDLATHFISLCDYGLASLPIAVGLFERATVQRKAALVGRVRSIKRYELSTTKPIFIANLSYAATGKHKQSAAWSMIAKLLHDRSDISIIHDQALTPPKHLEQFRDKLKSANLDSLDAATNWLASGSTGYISFGSEQNGIDGNSTLSSRDASRLGTPVHIVDDETLSSDTASNRWSGGMTALLGFVDAASSHKREPTLASPTARDLLSPASALQSATPDSGNASKHRILFSNVFFAPQTVGGATRVLKDNIDYILDHHPDEFEIAVLASDDENDLKGSTRVDTYRGIPVMRIATPQELDMDWRPFNADVYQHAVTVLQNFKPDLVHIHCLQRLSVAVAEACRDVGVPYIVTLHDAWWLSDYSFLINENGELAMPSRDILTQKFSKRIGLSETLSRASQLRSALAAAEARLAVSQSFGEIYRSCGFDVQTISNGVSRLKVQPRIPAGSHVRMAHVGGTQHHKGMFLIEAALRRNNFSNLAFSFVDLFRDPGDQSEMLWGTTPVTAHGKIPSSAIEEIYAQTDVLIAPSTWPESFGLVAREALNAGCWIIASNLGAMGDEITHGVNGFVIDVTQPDSLVEVLREIDRNPGRFKQSPTLEVDLRKVDDQSRDLVNFYKTIRP